MASSLHEKTSETTPHSSHPNLSPISFTFILPRWCPRPLRRHPPSDMVPRSCPLQAFPFNLSSVSFSSASLLFHPKKERPHHALSEPPAPPFQPHPGGDWASPRPRPRPMLCLWRLGTRQLGRLFMYGVRPVLPPPLLQDLIPSRQQSTGGWPRGAAPHAPHQSGSHLQHPPGVQEESSVLERTCSTLASRDSPLPAVPHHRTQQPPNPDEHCCSRDLPYREAGSCSSTATASSTAMQNCKTSCIVSFVTRCWSQA